MFVCLLSWTHLLKKPSPFTHFFWPILSPISPNSNDMVPISRNLKKRLFSFIFQLFLFVCLLSCFPYFLNFSLFVCLLSSFFLPFFLPLVKRTIILVIFFSNFQGFTSVPWQKVGRIWLGFDGNPSSSLFVCLLSCTPYLSKFPLFVGLLSFSLPFFPPPSRQTNDIFVNFFFKFFKASP